MYYFTDEDIKAINTDLYTAEMDIRDLDKHVRILAEYVTNLIFTDLDNLMRMNTMQKQINEMQKQINELRKQDATTENC